MQLKLVLGALSLLVGVSAGLETSYSGKCGPNTGLTCSKSNFGSCCSSHGYCGSTDAYCGSGCQSGYGTCTATGNKVSPDATCGGKNGYTCLKSKFGDCCSQHGYCGSTSGYCGTGCQSGFGSCSDPRPSSAVPASSSSSAPPTSPSQTVSQNARCGKGFGFTCQGSKWGNCCSQYSYCGRTKDYCGDGCQQGFGQCDGKPSSSKASTLSSSVRSSSVPASSSVSSAVSSSTGFSISLFSSSTITISASASSEIPSSTPAPSSSSAEPSSSVVSSSEISSSAVPSSTSSFTPQPTCAASGATCSSTLGCCDSLLGCFNNVCQQCVPSNQMCTINNFTNCCTQCCYFPTGDTQNGMCC